MSRHPKARFAALALVFLAVLSIVRGVSYFHLDTAPTGLGAAGMLLPITAWGWVWICGGALALAAVRWPRAISVAAAVMIAVHAVWIGSFLVTWQWGDSPRSYVSAITYGHGLLSWLIVPWMVIHTRAYEEARCSETTG